MEIYWNDVLLETKTPNSTMVTQESLIFYVDSDNGTIKFVEIGNSSDITGMHIDEVYLEYVEPENTSNSTNSSVINNTDAQININNTNNK